MISAEITFTSVRGHMMELDFPEEYRWGKCNPSALFQAPITTSISKEAEKLAQNLSAEVRGSDMLIIWTDCDREGENIGYEVAQHCLSKRKNLVVKRARFSAVIADQIHRACMNLVDLDLHAVHAVDARQQIDLRIGAAFTRLQTARLTPLLHVDRMVISYGPCQFPTLGFVVDHYRRVQAFVPEPFWYIDLRHKTGPQSSAVEFIWDRKHLFDESIVKILHGRCKEAVDAQVTCVQCRPTSKRKPSPLTTVELQKNLSRLTGMAPKKILDLAEALYQRGLLSYPRTETDQYDNDFDFVGLLDKQCQDAQWGALVSELCASAAGATVAPGALKYERPRNGRKNDKAHPPIHPTAHANDLRADEKKVYDYVTRRFLASCATDALGEETKVCIEMDGETFHTSGLFVKDTAYLKLFTYEHWSNKSIPEYRERQRFRPSTLTVKQGSTSAPKLLTEADLVHLMDKHGIGTDATIAEHIKKVMDRQYVVIQKQGNTNYLLPSTLGMGLVEGYEGLDTSQQLCKPKLRRDTETQLGLISAAQRTKDDTITECMEEYKKIYDVVERDFDRIGRAVSTYFQALPSSSAPSFPSLAQNTEAARAATASHDIPKCHCAHVCKSSTDARSGRSYWSCGKQGHANDDCGFFKWCSAPPLSSSEPRMKRQRTSAACPERIMCHCDLTAKRCETRKVRYLS